MAYFCHFIRFYATFYDNYEQKELKSMSNIEYRTAIKADSQEIANLMLIAGDGIFEFLLHDLIPNVSTIQLLQKQIEDKTTEFYYDHSMLASQDNTILGMSHSCHSGLLHKPLPELLPSDRIKHLDAFYKTKVPESLYLLALTVKSEARHHGIGSHFLEIVKEKARKMKLSKVTLHVWNDNKHAIRLYKKMGFNIISTIDIAKDELLPHDGGVLVMSCDI